MKEVNKLQDNNLYLELRNILRIGSIATKAAKEENQRYGIPKIFYRNGMLYYELITGEITTQKPEILK